MQVLSRMVTTASLPHMVQGNSSLHFQRRWSGSCGVLDDVAFQLDPELKVWLRSYKRAHVMQSFAPTCILFISNMVQANTLGNASIESVPAVLETPEARHRPGQLFVTASEFSSPTLEESYVSKKEGRQPKDRSLSRAGNPKRLRPHCHTTAGPTAKTTPLLRDAQKPWGGHPSCGRLADYSPSGTAGQWPPATCKRAATPESSVRRRRRLGPQAGTLKRLRPNCHRKEELKKQGGMRERTKGRGPNDPGVPAPLAAASCHGNCWRVVDGR